MLYIVLYCIEYSVNITTPISLSKNKCACFWSLNCLLAAILFVSAYLTLLLIFFFSEKKPVFSFYQFYNPGACHFYLAKDLMWEKQTSHWVVHVSETVKLQTHFLNKQSWNTMSRSEEMWKITLFLKKTDTVLIWILIHHFRVCFL